MASSPFNLPLLREGLKPFRLHYFPRLRSTNDHAAALRKRGDLYAPAVVLTGRQTAGRGRGSNTWFSAAGSLTVTFVLPVDETVPAHQLPLAAGVAARNAAAELAQNQNIQLKWPNDLVFQSAIGDPQSAMRKLAGLLCERLDNVDLIGIGMNVHPPKRALPKGLRDRVIHVAEIPPQSSVGGPAAALDLNSVVITLARHLHLTLIRHSETPFPMLLREYDAHHALVGRTVTIRGAAGEAAVTGRCQGLDDTGRLLVKNRTGVVRILAGHVEVA